MCTCRCFCAQCRQHRKRGVAYAAALLLRHSSAASPLRRCFCFSTASAAALPQQHCFGTDSGHRCG
eukprot:14802261-Alexandrium_andersonii.AAC.1